MTYVTEWGEVSERRIRLKRAYSEHGEVYVEAHCYRRMVAAVTGALDALKAEAGALAEAEARIGKAARRLLT